MSTVRKNQNIFVKGMFYLKENRFLTVIPIVFLILGDVFFFEKSSDWRTLPILFFYIFTVFRLKLKANTTFLMCLMLFVFIYIQFIFSPPQTFEAQYPKIPFGEKFAVWLYLLLIVGLIQKWKE